MCPNLYYWVLNKSLMPGWIGQSANPNEFEKAIEDSPDDNMNTKYNNRLSLAVAATIRGSFSLLQKRVFQDRSSGG
jgi:hypothetical protein